MDVVLLVGVVVLVDDQGMQDWSPGKKGTNKPQWNGREENACRGSTMTSTATSSSTTVQIVS